MGKIGKMICTERKQYAEICDDIRNIDRNMGNTSSSHIYHIESAYQCRRDMPPQVENRSICISASISPHIVYIISYLKALWHICAESCIFEGGKMQVDMSVYCSPAICGHVTTYHVIYMCYRYENNMVPFPDIQCAI